MSNELENIELVIERLRGPFRSLFLTGLVAGVVIGCVIGWLATEIAYAR